MRITTLSAALILFSLTAGVLAGPLGQIRDAAQAVTQADPAVAKYDALLERYVDADGWVDYAGLATAGRADLDAYVESLAVTPHDDLPPDDRLAHLINAYNAFTLRLIVENWPRVEAGEVDSITDLHGGKPWDTKRWELAGQTVSLNQLEHEMIRRDYPREPRIHWAVVCAAFSCPPLRPEAYTGDRLDDQLAEQEAYVLNFDQPRFVRQTDSGLAVTKLFEWYGGDFGPDWKAYVTTRLGVPATDRVGFLPYDWKLNATQNRPGRH